LSFFFVFVSFTFVLIVLMLLHGVCGGAETQLVTPHTTPMCPVPHLPRADDGVRGDLRQSWKISRKKFKTREGLKFRFY